LSGYRAARAAAVAALGRATAEGWVRNLLDAADALRKAGDQEYQDELQQARVLRFCRLAKSVILAHRLRESRNRSLTTRFERLLKDEAASCLAPAVTREEARR
jgi:hypothetical protein